ncbi:cytochrome ubiquinol oxidase subunit I [Rhodospirillaceae bacterium SYSU D60014]|uniref:cytochrome ubiquinol oxidase subunit I n=1 Tax=Virgifigura deserti TaxID=2268457 RepID=UPI000E668545
MELDPVFLSRVQFAFVIAFHILFPAFTIGLASYIAVLEGLWFATKRDIYFHISRFWTRIFAVSFGMGVVSGIVMSFQFGTNWSRFSDATANVLGPLLSYEVLTAFFLEATFLGILLFGRNLVSPRVHFLSAVMVALGTLVSSFWILAANSWMHTPAGYEVRDGIFHVTSWVEAIFNPSFPYRLSHMVTAAFLTTAFVVIGISAWYLLKGQFTDSARRMLSMTLWLVTVLAPLQIVLGDLHGLNTFEHQPVKVAAMEGHWETQTGAPMILFAVPDPETETNHFEIAIPYLGSLILVHDVMGEVRGLKAWPADQRPPVAIVFYAFRIMVSIGFLMLGVVLASLWLRRRKRLFETRWFLRLCAACAPIGFVALIAGWFVTEVGRQPWVVYGVMRTADATSPAITGGGVLASLLGYITVYAIIFTAGVYYILRLVQRGPGEAQAAPQGRAARPLSGAQQPFEAGD